MKATLTMLIFLTCIHSYTKQSLFSEFVNDPRLEGDNSLINHCNEICIFD